MAAASLLSRGRLALVLNVVLAVGAIGLAVAPSGEGAPRLSLASATGGLSLSNSRQDAAIFLAAGMRPGQAASGSVRIANTGSVPGTLSVRPTPGAEVQGPGGGRLSARLVLQIVDVTDTGLPVTVYAGSLSAMPAVVVGGLSPGEAREYAFIATLPAGAADNAYQGARLATGFTWTAHGSDAATATPTPNPPTTPTPADPGPPPAPGAGGGAVLGSRLLVLPSAKRCVSRRKLRIRIRRRAGVAFKSIRITVNRRTRVKLRGLKARNVKAKVNLRRLPSGRFVVKVVVTTTAGRKIVSKRRYRACAAKPTKVKRVKQGKRRKRR